jgi:hypothetical protein
VPSPPSTFAELEAEANRKLARVKAGAAAFGSLVAITFGGLSANLMNATPRVLLALLATAIIVSGFLMARTFIAFYNCNETLGLLLRHRKGAALPDPRQAKKDARAGGRYGSAFAADEYYIGSRFYRVTITMIVVTVALFLGAVWWSAAGAPPVQKEQLVNSPVPSPHPTASAHPIVTPTVTVIVTLPPVMASPPTEPGQG